MNARHTPLSTPGKGRPSPRDGRLWDAVILGAGASGLFCAMTAAARGRNVLLIDHAAKAGRKLSITGGGKCNVTNRRVSPDDYHGDNPDFCRSALTRFTPEQLVAMLREGGIELEERDHDQLFCRRSAKDVVRLLEGRCLELGCRFAMEERVRGLTADADGCFTVTTGSASHRARKTVIALGGPAWPQVGATGSGHEIARSFGHEIVPVRPALSGLVMPENWPLAHLAGIALPATIRVTPDAIASPPAKKQRAKARNAADPAARCLSLLFTHNGVSGPAALQASLYWRPGMRLVLDLLPSLPEGEGVLPLLEAGGAGKALCRNIFKKVLPGRICDALLPEELGAKRCAELSRAQREAVAALFRAHEVTPLRTEGFAKAEVTAGGVSAEQVSSKTMESRIAAGLYFCGEVLDVTGRLGGYNLHWAFASGKAAGEAL